MNGGGFAPFRVFALQPRLLLGAVIGIVVLVYLPGLQGPFVFDDTTSITGVPAVALTRLDITQLIAAATANESGPLGRPLASLTFALNHYFAGGFDSTIPFKLTNLLIHVANTALIYLFLSRLRPSFESLPVLLLTAAWALHPIHLTSVLYVVQRMTSLSSTFVLMGLIVFVDGRRRFPLEQKRGLVQMAAGLAIGLCGMLAKESAVLILLYALVVESAAFSRVGFTRPLRRRLIAFYAVTVLSPIIALLSTFWGAVADSYAARDFTMSQRLLTESRVLWYYARLIVAPSLQELSLFHDDITVSTGLLDPWTTAPALAGLLACLSGALLMRRRAPMVSFAVLWFLAGHSLESSFIGLEIAHEHRNYLPSLGIIAGVIHGLLHMASRPGSNALKPLCLSLIAAYVTTTGLRAAEWQSATGIIEGMARRHPDSVRTNTMLAELRLAQGRPLEGLLAYAKAISLAPEQPFIPIRLAAALASIRVAEGPRPNASAAPSAQAVSMPAPFPSLENIIERVPNPNGDDRLALRSRLVERVTLQLATRPIVPDTVLALRSLASCVVQVPDCVALEDNAITWHRTVLENPAASHRTHLRIAFELFHIAMARNDFALALDAVGRGLALDPGSVNLRLMKLDALIAANRLGEAEESLSVLLQDPRIGREHAEAIENLRGKLARKQPARFSGNEQGSLPP